MTKHGEGSGLWDGGGRENGQYKAEHMGKTYYFCAKGCKKAFEENPHKYMKM